MESPSQGQGGPSHSAVFILPTFRSPSRAIPALWIRYCYIVYVCINKYSMSHLCLMYIYIYILPIVV